jgi:hypothetical protein
MLAEDPKFSKDKKELFLTILQQITSLANDILLRAVRALAPVAIPSRFLLRRASANKLACRQRAQNQPSPKRVDSDMARRTALVLLGLLLLSGCGKKYDPAFGKAADSLPAARAAAEKVGLATEPTGFGSPQSDLKNAAPAYTEIIKTLNARDVRERYHTAITAAWDGKMPTYDAARKDLEPIAQKLRAAAALPRSDFQTDYSNPDTTNDLLARMRLLARLTGAESLRAAEAGDWKTAIDWLETGYKIARHSEQETRFEGLLVTMQIVRIQQRLAEVLIQRSKDEPAILRQIQTAQRLSPELDYRPHLRGEVVAQVALMRSLFTKNQDNLELRAEQIATFAGTAEDPKTMVHLGLLNETPPEVARKALESRALELWTEIWPTVGAAPHLPLKPALDAAQAPRIKRADPAEVVIRTGYGHLLTSLAGVEDAREGMLAVNMALATLLKEPLPAAEAAFAKERGTILDVTPERIVVSRKPAKQRRSTILTVPLGTP